jgi:hypothetical protein
MTNTISGRNIEASIQLEQIGKTGPISYNINFTPKGNQAVPASHEAMSHLVALWLQLETLAETTEASINDIKFTTTLVLSQDEIDGPVYSKLNMEPKLKVGDEGFPMIYEANSYLATAWLQMAGVIDEEGNVVDDDALDNVDLTVRAPSRVH